MLDTLEEHWEWSKQGHQERVPVHPVIDDQWPELMRLLEKFGFHWTPLKMSGDQKRLWEHLRRVAKVRSWNTIL